MWISFQFYSLLLLITSEITEGRTYFKWRSARCQKYISKEPNFSVVGKSLSDIKCLEYTWQVKDEIERQRFETRCNRTYGISGGKSTRITKYPHMAALGWKTIENKWSFLCGGSLISPNFVLTAAHCSKTVVPGLKSSKPQLVRMGGTNIYSNSIFEKYVDKKVRDIIVHPKYSSPKKYYDIALINIEEVEKFTKFVHPACLYNNVDFISPLDATGWGLINNTKTSSVLQSAVLDILPSTECMGLKNRNWKKFKAHQLCAGKVDGSANTCNGDSGAPLQYRMQNQSHDTNMNVIVGITSFGKKCNHHQPLGMYVKINHFIDWIERHVWPSNDNKLVPMF